MKITVREKYFSQQVVDLAKILNWKVYRCWLSIHSPAGFPDLTMCRGERLIFAELKSDSGKVSLKQEEWLDALKITKAEVYVWYPGDFDQIAEILQAERR